MSIFPQHNKLALAITLLTFFISGGLLLGQITTNYSFTLRDRAVYRPFLEKQLENSLVFVPPVWGPVLLHPFAYLGNSKSLDGPVIYALDRGGETLTLINAYPDRTLYRFDVKDILTNDFDNKLFGLAQIANEPPETDLVKLSIVYNSELRQPLRIINPTDKPYVYTYIWNNDQTETYLLDDSSWQDKEYEIEWIISSLNKFQFKGPYKKQDSSITTLSPDHPLTIAVSFCDDASRATQEIFERRFRFNLTASDQIAIISPPEEWHNPHWPDESGWRMEDIDAVMKNR